MPLPLDLKYFQPGEFHNPDGINADAVYALDVIRGIYGVPLVVTDDARTPEEVSARQNPLQGGSATSLHASGRAFDLRWPVTPALCFKLMQAVCTAERGSYRDSIELEIDATEGNKHFHIGLKPTPSGSTLLIRKAV